MIEYGGGTGNEPQPNDMDMDGPHTAPQDVLLGRSSLSFTAAGDQSVRIHTRQASLPGTVQEYRELLQYQEGSEGREDRRRRLGRECSRRYRRRQRDLNAELRERIAQLEAAEEEWNAQMEGVRQENADLKEEVLKGKEQLTQSNDVKTGNPELNWNENPVFVAVQRENSVLKVEISQMEERNVRMDRWIADAQRELAHAREVLEWVRLFVTQGIAMLQGYPTRVSDMAREALQGREPEVILFQLLRFVDWRATEEQMAVETLLAWIERNPDPQFIRGVARQTVDLLRARTVGYFEDFWPEGYSFLTLLGGGNH